eukprot:GHVP01059376.1.p1 GENE.GHVP01059376.1~~GHVP01059376.1.p1  ORF type:complete len:101 (-),score=13.66 GHVP01059376.1:80-382(-)
MASAVIYEEPWSSENLEKFKSAKSLSLQIQEKSQSFLTSFKDNNKEICQVKILRTLKAGGCEGIEILIHALSTLRKETYTSQVQEFLDGLIFMLTAHELS